MDIEEAEVEMCKRHKRYFEETKLIGTSAWRKKHWRKGEIDVQRDICLFKARYSSSLKIEFICDGCSETIEGRWYRCLHCIDFDLCTNCYKNGKTTSEHLDSHNIIELRLVKTISNFQREEIVLFDLQANFGYVKQDLLTILVSFFYFCFRHFSYFCLSIYQTFLPMLLK